MSKGHLSLDKATGETRWIPNSQPSSETRNVTPGPWEYEPNDGVIVFEDKYGNREIAWSDDDYYLAAAAPELLQAVRLALEQMALDDSVEAANVRIALRTAIRKAEGRWAMTPQH